MHVNIEDKPQALSAPPLEQPTEPFLFCQQSVDAVRGLLIIGNGVIERFLLQPVEMEPQSRGVLVQLAPYLYHFPNVRPATNRNPATGRTIAKLEARKAFQHPPLFYHSAQ